MKRLAIAHDRQELRDDFNNGHYAAAVRKEAEMNPRRAGIPERKSDLGSTSPIANTMRTAIIAGAIATLTKTN